MKTDRKWERKREKKKDEIRKSGREGGKRKWGNGEDVSLSEKEDRVILHMERGGGREQRKKEKEKKEEEEKGQEGLTSTNELGLWYRQGYLSRWVQYSYGYTKYTTVI
jgi:hypothetical protein